MISFKRFGGEVPRVLPADLPDQAAQFAQDVDTTRGELRGLRSPVLKFTAANPVKSFFAYNQAHWFSWYIDVNAVRGPVVDDQYSRMYFTDSGTFRVGVATSGGDGGMPAVIYAAGVPQPVAAPTISTSEWELPTIYSRTSVSSPVVAVPGALIQNFDFFFAAVSKEGAATDAIAHNATTQVFADIYRPNWRVSPFTKADPTVPVGATVDPATFTQQGAVWANVVAYGNNGEEDVLPAFYAGGYYYLYLGTGGAPGPAYMNTWSTAPVAGNETRPSAGLYYRLQNGWYANSPYAPQPYSAATSETVPALDVVWYVGANMGLSAPTYTTRLLVDKTTQILPNVPDLDSWYATLSRTGTNTWAVTYTNTTQVDDTRAYVFTYVNTWGEEGAPSPPSIVDVTKNQSVSVACSSAGIATGYQPLAKVRVYRTATGSTNTDYLFVKEMTFANTATITDDVPTERLGEPVSTLDFLPPRADLAGVCMMANGVMAAFRSNEVHFSEPYLPYAFKPGNVQTFPFEVVGICPCEGGLYVTTKAYPFLVSGTTPESMVSTRIASVQAGVNKNAICNLGAFVAYASNDGIVLLQGVTASIEQSLRLFTREEWRSRYQSALSRMRFAAHDGKLVVTFDTGAQGFMIDFDEAGVSLVRLNDSFATTFVHPESDAMYAAVGNAVYEFNAYAIAESRKLWTWHSKDVVLPKPTNFGVLQLRGAGSVTATVYGDGVARYSGTLAIPAYGDIKQRLPSGFFARTWSVRLAATTTTDKVAEANLAVTMPELAFV